MMATGDFLLSGMTNSMSDCGVSFGSGKGAGFIAKSVTLESCIDFTITSGSIVGPLLGTSLTWTF
jgi:hypothetical protein